NGVAFVGKHLMTVEWLQDGMDTLGVVDIFSGQRYVLATKPFVASAYIQVSPDERLAAVWILSAQQNTFKMMAVDGSWQVPVPGGIDALFVWSPDSTMLMFKKSDAEIEIRRSNGTLLYQKQITSGVGIPHWIPCARMNATP